MGYANGWTGRGGSLNVTLTSEAGQRPLTGYSEEGGPSLACADPAYDSDLWFADPSDNEGRDLQLAKRLCRSCPIRNECLERNLDEPAGVFGGFDGWERRIIREGPRLCRGCRCLIPTSLSICVSCSRAESKERAAARLRAKVCKIYEEKS